MFNPSRLSFARERRGLKKIDLANATGLSSRAITAFEAGEYEPDEGTRALLSEALRFPISFFTKEDPIEILPHEIVSFRARSKMSVMKRNKALGTGRIALMLNKWLENRFSLPKADLPEMPRDTSPEDAAAMTRQYWGLGQGPIKNMVHLLEAKGVRIFSMALSAHEVDAFSLWFDECPYVFLNTEKTGERSRFDAAHELGHLILHKLGNPHGVECEKEADAFASAFLMPSASIKSMVPRYITMETILKMKQHWRVSVAAMNYRLHTLGITTEWLNRMFCIEIAKKGYQKIEPNGIARETSSLFEKVFNILREEGISKFELAKQLDWYVEDIDELTYGMMKLSVVSGSTTPVQIPNISKPQLTVVK